MDCKKCKYADISSVERTIEVNGITLTQKGGGVICTCDHIKNITITDGKMVCSEYAEREEQKQNE